MDKKYLLRSFAKNFNLNKLPIGAYIVTKEGEFIECNTEARKILKLPSSGEIKANIKDFYSDPSERDKILKKIEDNENDGFSPGKIVINFNVKNSEKRVQTHCRFIRDPDSNEIIGVFGCLVDVTWEMIFSELFEFLPVGVYLLDENDKIIRVNDAFVKILGYKSKSELEGENVSTIYENPDYAPVFRNRLINKKAVINDKVELKKKSGEPIFVSVNSYKIPGKGQSYKGRRGTIVDVTAEENYRRLLSSIPVGTYMVDNENKIIDCNESFAKMFDYDDIKSVRGEFVLDLYDDPYKDYDNFMKELKKKHDEGANPLVGYNLKFKSKKGRTFVAEVNTRLLVDKEGKSYGRAGAVRDISGEVALRDLRDDIGKTLHTYSSNLIMLQHSLVPLVEVIGPDPFDKKTFLEIEDAISALDDPAKHLEKSLARILEISTTSTEMFNALSVDNWDVLHIQRDLLTNYEEQIPYPEFIISALTDSAKKIIAVCKSFEKGLPREMEKDLKRKAKELGRICSLITYHQALDAIQEMEFEVRALREYVIFRQRASEKLEICRIESLVSISIHNLSGLAKYRNVEIKQSHKTSGIKVKVEERSLIRALSHLFFNAIKYSLRRGDEEQRWIIIRSYIEDTDINNRWVCVEVENYGVPITKEEIDKELIFQFGYRGDYSGNRRKVGTGIGLMDTREVARKLGGDVVVSSHPADDGAKEDDYDQPFLTKAVLKLPVKPNHGVQNEKN